ncbi:MAG: FimV/HubP family polar landmark protein, partial [Rhodocyclaceae bacterium]
AEGREVKRGDTLNKIASELKPEGVSLEQMLVGLLRANQDAFDGGNMNRLRTGKILSMPEPSALEAVSEGEARKIVIAQSGDWNAYRRKLAGIAAQSSAKEDVAKQESAGRIAAKVEDKADAVAEAKDQVRISKADVAPGKAGAAAKSTEEDLVAKEKALKEAGDRLASLEKNVVELQKLIDLKSRNLAELQKQAGSKEAAPAEAAKPEAAKPAAQAVVAPAVAEKAAEKPAEPAPAEPVAAKPEETKHEPKPEPKPDEMPQPKPRPVPPPPPPFEEPGFVSRLLDDPSALQDAAASILALLGGLFLYKRRRQRQDEKKAALGHPSATQVDDAADNAVFGSTVGQSVEASSRSVEHTDFSQAGPGSIDTDEVDPVAEADVYIAYGRDTQAEEILLEAKQKDPRRYAIHLKLLEIYANRKNPKAFELLAAELYNELGGVGAEWEKAAAMGLRLDPTNPLYGGAAEPTAEPAPFDADATMIIPAQSMESVVPEPETETETFPEPDDLADLAPIPAPETAAVPEPAAPSELMSLDFDLGPYETHVAPPAAEQPEEVGSEPVLPETAVDTGALDFDFDLGASPEPAEAPQEAPLQAPAEVVEPAALSDMAAFDLDFELPETAAEPAVPVALAPAVAAPAEDIDFGFDINFEETPAPAPVAEPEPELPAEEVSVGLADLAPADSAALEFDIDLPESVESVDRSPPAPQPAFDMSAISLDLADELPPVSLPEATVPDELPLPAFEPSLEDDFRIDDLPPVTEAAVEARLPFASDLDAGFESDFEPAPEVDAALREEVATKLDLAKAYEEMGDLEGARELLLEVLIEGDATQKEKAQVILDKIGG